MEEGFFEAFFKDFAGAARFLNSPCNLAVSGVSPPFPPQVLTDAGMYVLRFGAPLPSVYRSGQHAQPSVVSAEAAWSHAHSAQQVSSWRPLLEGTSKCWAPRMCPCEER